MRTLPACSHPLAIWLATGLLAVALPAAALAVTIPIEENDTVRLQPSGNNATLELVLNRAPASANGAVVRVSNRDNYSFWSAPLTRRRNAWTATIDRAGLEAIIRVDRLLAEFPGAGPNNDVLQLVVPGERLRTALEPAAAMVSQQPLFFEPPAPPEKPELPSTDVGRVQAEGFAMSARRWDREITAHQYEFSAAISRAHAFFLDLRTAGRLPWPAQVLDQLAQAYEGLKARAQEIEKSRADWRATAQQFVQQWNAAHAGEPPITLTFAEA